jgi:hypothetical protein
MATADVIGSKKEETSTPMKKLGFLKGTLRSYEKDFKDWGEKSSAINDKYKAKNSVRTIRELSLNSDARYNILWSNIQILLPSLYARTPKPDVERRHKNSNQTTRLTADVLERSLGYEMDEQDFDGTILAAVLDYLISARGTARVMYEPKIEKGKKVDEASKIKFVYRDDFRHGPGRIWSEVTWVAFQTYESRDSLIENFGEKIGAEIPLDASPNKDANDKDRGVADNLSRARIWEIWDKETKNVYWVSLNYPKILKTVRDPLRLKGFFPCPKPLYATVSTDNLIPVPDYILYQTHAITLDVIQQRLGGILDCARANGVYNAAWGVELGNFMKKGDGQMTPVTNYGDLTKAGGLAGIMEFAPVDEFLSVLSMLNESAAIEVQKIYEITGISDIVRGSSDPNETAKAQQMKQKFGSLRLSARQTAVQAFVRDLVSLMGEVICTHFDPEKIRQISEYDLMPDATPEAPVAPEGQQPYPPEVIQQWQQQQRDRQWKQIVSTLKNQFIRSYSIDIETDSTVAIDYQEQKEAWGGYLEAVGTFLNNSLQVLPAAPSLGPYVKETLLSVSRAYKCGAALEGTLTSSFDAYIKQLMTPPPPPPPDPAIQVQQLKSADFKEKLRVDELRVTGTLKTKDTQVATKAQHDEIKLLNQTKEFIAKQKLELEKIKKEIVIKKAELETELQKVRIQSGTTLKVTKDDNQQASEAAILAHHAKVSTAKSKSESAKKD